MIPSIGRIVHYTLTEGNAKQITRLRIDSGVGSSFARVGNTPSAGEVYPMLITRLWTDNPDQHSVVQGQVFLDGNDSLWVTSVKQGDNEGQWHQPPMTA